MSAAESSERRRFLYLRPAGSACLALAASSFSNRPSGLLSRVESLTACLTWWPLTPIDEGDWSYSATSSTWWKSAAFSSTVRLISTASNASSRSFSSESRQSAILG